MNITTDNMQAKQASWSFLLLLKNRFHLIILFMLPILITLINPNWIYNPPVLNDVDTWIYTGLFHDFFELAVQHPSNQHYPIERLTAILPGYILYQLFTPEIANVILHLTVYLVTIFSLYAVIQRLFDKDSAFVATLCLGTYTWFLRAAGHDYIDGIGIAYYSLALWCVTEAAYRQRYQGYLIGGGIFLGAAFVTHMFWAALIVLVGLYYLALNWNNHQHSWWKSFVYTLLGSVSLISLMMIFNAITIGEWNIFKNSLGFILQSPNITALRPEIIKYYGQTPMTWMVLPCVFMTCAIFYLSRWKYSLVEIRFNLRLVIIVFSFTIGLFIILHYMTSFAYLIIYLYMSLMIPSLFLLFGGLISMMRPKITVKIGILALLLLLIPFFLTILIEALETALLNVTFVWSIVAITLVFFMLNLLKFRKPLFLIGAFSVMSLMFNGNTGIAYHDRLYTYQIFKTTMDTIALIDTKTPDLFNFSQLTVWTVIDNDENEIYGTPFRGMSQPLSSRSFNWKTIVEHMQVWTWYQSVKHDVLLVSNRENIVEEINETLDGVFDVHLHHTFLLPNMSPPASHQGYILSLTRLDSYGQLILISGDNIQRPSDVKSSTHTTEWVGQRGIAWSGPQTDVVLRFNLPTPKSEVTVQLCGLMATTILEDELIALVNQTPITFTRQPAINECFVHYVADIPQALISGEHFTEIALTIPVAKIDEQLIKSDKIGMYGIAFTTIIFYEKETP